jgi:L,D-peptidoglycan transpeptidase YkuD (ErfK/YbiS/YcfS/YnhG family)
MTDAARPPAPSTASNPLANAYQVLRVVAADWTSTTATLQRFAREHCAQDWQSVGRPVSVSLGRSGLAWGIGLNPATNVCERRKQEGDGCAPAGIFAITALFGDAAADSPFAQSARLPYRCATGDLKCVDDPASRYYNQMVDPRTVDAIDWHSHEEMRRNDERYAIGAVIAHNSDCRPGRGSCLFLHVWQAEGIPTAGCTAGSLADITEICAWLDTAANPLLVQLPDAEYRFHKAAWGLP